MPLYICGFVVLGAAFQNHLSVGALVMGWGIAEVATMVNIVAICEFIHFVSSVRMCRTLALDAYTNDCFPQHQGEISALLNITRTLGGFSVAYFQVPWAIKHGALQTFGCEAAYVVFLPEVANYLMRCSHTCFLSIVAGLFVFTVPALQLKGRMLRVRGSHFNFLFIYLTIHTI